MTIKVTVTALACLLVLAGGTITAQTTTMPQYALTHVGGLTSSNALIGIDASGAIKSTIFLSAFSPPSAVTMAPANDAILAFDSTGVSRIDALTGKRTYTTLTTGGGNIHFGMVDEDGGILWVIGSGTGIGRVYKAARPDGTHTTLFRKLGPTPFDVIERVGSTGGYALSFTSGSHSSIVVLRRDGTVKSTLSVPTTVTGMDWNVWEDKLYATPRNTSGKPAILAIDVKTNTVTAVGPSGAIVNDLHGVETFEQASNRIVVAEAGTDPQHLFTYDPVAKAVTTIHTSKGKVRFADVEIFGARTFWGLNLVELGSKTPLSVNFGPAHSGDTYQVALSFGFRPGINVAGVGRIHLNADGLFLASVLAGPPTFQNFSGFLDKAGRATNQPAFIMPTIGALQGVRIYGSAVAYNRSGITAISNSWGATILGQPE